MTRKKVLTAIAAVVIAAGTTVSAVPAARAGDAGPVAFTGAALAKDAKISLPDARAIALKVYAGEIVSEELEKEKGGSGLRYSFDIKNGRVTHEIGVDAKTGRLLENSIEGAQHD